MDFRKRLVFILTVTLMTLSFNGCSNKMYFNKDITDKLKSKLEYKIILIENKDSNLYKTIYRTFKSYSWNVIKTKDDINDIVFNKQYNGLPKYIFILEKENIYYNNSNKGYSYYHIYIQDIKDDEIVYEFHDYGNDEDINNHIILYLRKVF
jgi:hypothetical protein